MKNFTSQGLIRIAGNFQGCYGMAYQGFVTAWEKGRHFCPNSYVGRSWAHFRKVLWLTPRLDAAQRADISPLCHRSKTAG